MRTSPRRITKSVVLWSGLGLAACGVEVGNPTGGKKGGSGGGGSSGTLSIFLADSFSRAFKGAVLNLQGVSLMSSEGLDAANALTAIGGAFSGALDSQTMAKGQSFPLAKSSEVPTGDYGGLALDLDGSAPLTVDEGGGAPLPAVMANQERTVAVDQSFSIQEGEEVSIVFHLDLRRSLKKNGGRFDFGPIAHLVRKEDEAAIEGVVAGLNSGQVCAYLRRQPDFNDGRFGPLPKRPPRGEGPRLHGDDDHEDDKKGPQGKRFKAKRPDSMDPKETGPAQDGDPTCERAFATDDVVDGQFRLDHLWPGLYQLRFVDASGVTREDLKMEVQAKPGQTVSARSP